MNSVEIKQEIEKTNKKIDNILSLLEEDKSKIIDMLKPFITNSMKEVISNQIKDKAEVIQKLDVEKLKTVKEELSKLQNNLDDHIDKELNKDCYWEYKNDDIKSYSSVEPIKNGINRVLGFAGEIFLKYEITKVNIKGSYHSGPSYWQYPDYYCKEIYYNRYLTIPKNIETLFNEYKNHCIDLNNLKYELESLNRKLSQAEALEKWEDI